MERSRTIGVMIRALSHQIKRVMDSLSQEESLTGTQLMVLCYIKMQGEESGDIYQKDIEGVFDIRGSTATNILNRLEARNFITRQAAVHDARLKRIVLLPDAERICRKLENRLVELEQKMTKGIPPQELKVFYRNIDRISQNIAE